MKINQHITDDDFEQPVHLVEDDEYECPEGWVCVPMDSSEKYYDFSVLEEELRSWAKRENFGLVKAKSEMDRVYYVCSYSNRYRPLKSNRDAKRLGSSHKTGCPFVLRVTRKKSDELWSVNDAKSEEEHTHNHPCTSAYNSISPLGKRNLTTQQDIKTIADMTSNKSKIPEIIKNISKFNGNPVLNYQDIANISKEIHGDNSGPNSKINDAQVLINKMINEGYHVSHQVSQVSSSKFTLLKNIFFSHESMVINSKKMGQVFVIDATYSVNNAKMPLVSIYGVHNIGGSELINFPVAFAFVSDEQESTYKWVLEQLKNLIVNSSSEKNPLFVTDKCTALMNALDVVFPASEKILYVWHMMNNVRSELNKGRFTNAKIKEKCISLVQQMIETKIPEDFETRYAKFKRETLDRKNITDYADIADDEDNDFQDPLGKNQAYNYFKKNWMPIKSKWAGHLTKKLTHFGCLTTQRAESAHRALKFGMSKRMDLITAFEHMNKYWTGLNGKFEYMIRIERQKTDLIMANNKRLEFIRNKVSNAALIAAHSACLAVDADVLFEGENYRDPSCTCYAYLNSKLPCVHTVLRLEVDGKMPNDGGKIQLYDIDERWHLSEIDDQPLNASSVKENVSLLGENRSQLSWFPIISELELKFRELENDFSKRKLLENKIRQAIDECERSEDNNTSFNATLSLMKLPTSEDVKKIGRPPKEVCHRPVWKKSKDSSKSRADQVELKVTSGKYAFSFEKTADDKSDKGKQSLGNVKAERSLSLKKRRKPVEIEGLRRDSKKIKSELDQAILPVIKSDNYVDVSDNYVDVINPAISLNTSEIIDVKGDGFCGFRCIAVNLFDDENKFWQVKMKMRDVLLSNKDYYIKSFSGYIDFEQLEKVVCFGIGNKIKSNDIQWSMFESKTEVRAPLGYWFYTHACAQLAADTFRRPFACYVEREFINSIPEIFFPLLKTDTFHRTIEGSEATLPTPIILHNVGGNHWITLKLKKSVKMLWPRPSLNFWNYACSKLNKGTSYKSSTWNKYLHFVPRIDIVPARVEDAIDLLN